MKRHLRRFVPSPAMVVALTALFLALGGSAYALVITGKSIKNNTVTGSDIRNGSLRGKDVQQGLLRRRRDQGEHPRHRGVRGDLLRQAPASPWSPAPARWRAAAA